MDETSSTPPDPSTAARPPAATPPSAAWDGPSPDAVAWLLVSWHNRHPLARRISLQDVHTVGAVALPFLAQALPREPGLAPTTPGAPAVAPPAKRRWPWQRATAAGPRPLWAESFIPGLKPAAVAALALDHGFTAAPDELPLRRVDIANGDMTAGDPNQGGAWPMELVLLSAAIDAGPARTRVLVGRRDRVLGRRALDPVRLGAVAAVGVLLLVLLTWLLWPSSGGDGVDAASEAASAASAPAAISAAISAAVTPPVADAASSPVQVASAPSGWPSVASSPGDAASATADAVSVPTAPVESASASVIPSIRPTLGGETARSRPPLGAGVTGATGATVATGAKGSTTSTGPAPSADSDATTPSPAAAASGPPTSGTEAEQRLQLDDAGLADVMKRAAPGGKLVALVSLPQKTRPEAEAQLTRMRELIGQTLRGRVPNGEVFQTKEGWRAAVWPFGSREEAQLINATLLARGVRARAVDF